MLNLKDTPSKNLRGGRCLSAVSSGSTSGRKAGASGSQPVARISFRRSATGGNSLRQTAGGNFSDADVIAQMVAEISVQVSKQCFSFVSSIPADFQFAAGSAAHRVLVRRYTRQLQRGIRPLCEGVLCNLLISYRKKEERENRKLLGLK